MRTNTAVINIIDTVFLLRVKLGKLRAWDDFLADNRRGKQSINGLTLMPICRKKNLHGISPMYALTDVEQFIAEVIAINPTVKPEPIMPISLAVEDMADWESPLNLFDSRGGLTYLPKAKAAPAAIASPATLH